MSIFTPVYHMLTGEMWSAVKGNNLVTSRTLLFSDSDYLAVGDLKLWLLIND